MKQFLPVLSFALLLTACGTTTADKEVKSLQSVQQTSIDTAGLTQFQQWKAQNELSIATPVAEEPQPAPMKPQPKVIIRERIVERPVAVRTPRPAPVATVPTPEPTASENEGLGEIVAKSESENAAKEPVKEEKKGWSKAAKGAVIGGAGGAVIGGIISKKNPAVGAAIGGVLGGAVGYGIGKNKDKKDGRY